MYQAVIFDLDGTLLNTLSDLANAGNYALVELGLPIYDHEKYKQMLGYGKKKLIEEILPKGMELCNTVANQLFDSYYMRHMLDETIIYQGINELLKTLRDKQIKLAVLTNKPYIFATEMIEHYFPQMFDYIQGVDNDDITKPNPLNLLKIIKEFDVMPINVLYVGDTDVDVLTGQNANVDTAGVLWGFRSKDELKAFSPTYLVDNTDELETIIFK